MQSSKVEIRTRDAALRYGDEWRKHAEYWADMACFWREQYERESAMLEAVVKTLAQRRNDD